MRAAALAFLLLVPLLAACGRVDDGSPAAATGGDGPLTVVATTGMLADAVDGVGGARVEVTALMGPGVDPHLYQASEGDVRRLSGADLIVYNGLHLEARLSEVLARIEGRTFAAGEALDESRLLAPPEFAGQYDPHVWFDVDLWSGVVEAIREELTARDPDGAEEYAANEEAYLAELRELHEWAQEQAARVPEDRRVLVTAHDAFNYFGRAYGFEVRGLQGISTATEAGAGDVQRLADFIAERELPAIFVETSVSPRAIQAVQEAVRARGHEVGIGEELYSDALGDPGTPEGTYVGMVRHNVTAIVEGLLGEDA
jgi:manganese/zinc/iron transport system substrate-binding protein